MKKWTALPPDFKNEEVKPYYELLAPKGFQLMLKRLFDIVASFVMILLLSPVLIVVAIMVKADSKGPVFFKQERVTRYGRKFKIIKFRTMVVNAERLGSSVTGNHDPRITKVGRRIRDFRLDEIPQLFNVLVGDMSFVGMRPEVPQFVDRFSPEMYAALLMPAGVTCEAAIKFKNEAELLAAAEDTDAYYETVILPEKMRYNLDYIKKFSLGGDLSLMFKTVAAVFKK